ncbi:hypothetical protein AHAS_Ahas16G0168800 [Arachis hypogaea]
MQEDLFKLLGEKHQLYEFLDTFYVQCSYMLFNKEHVKAILSEIVKHKAAENEQRIQSYMNMLVVVESPVDSALIPDRAPLSAYQYFKNMRNFLVAVQLYKRMIWLQN